MFWITANAFYGAKERIVMVLYKAKIVANKHDFDNLYKEILLKEQIYRTKIAFYRTNIT